MFTDLENQIKSLLVAYPKVYMITITIDVITGIEYVLVFTNTKTFNREFKDIVSMIEFLDKH